MLKTENIAGSVPALCLLVLLILRGFKCAVVVKGRCEAQEQPGPFPSKNTTASLTHEHLRSELSVGSAKTGMEPERGKQSSTRS